MSRRNARRGHTRRWSPGSCSAWSLPRAAATTAAEVEAEAARSRSCCPESKTARYESQDRPLFEKKVKALCSDCEVIYSNADQDAAKQQQQAEAALTKGAKVLVLDPVDAASAARDRRAGASSRRCRSSAMTV